MDTIVLLSGGVDSTALIEYHLTRKDNVRTLFIDYSQKSVNSEYHAAKAISGHYNVPFFKQNMESLVNERGEYKCRNAKFILTACGYLRKTSGLISLGIHTGSIYYDTTKEFVEDIQKLLDGYYGGTVKLVTPFLNYTKKQVYQYALKTNLPLHLTFSCENSDSKPCGTCGSCIDRSMLNDLILNKKNK